MLIVVSGDVTVTVDGDAINTEVKGKYCQYYVQASLTIIPVEEAADEGSAPGNPSNNFDALSDSDDE